MSCYNDDELNKLIKRRESLLDYMKRQEFGNDFYYTYGSYYSDRAELDEIEKRIDELKGKSDD